MDIKVKSEPIIERDVEHKIGSIVEGNIKEEKELIIESDWTPTKFEDEENEYYQEFVAVVENNSGYEQYITENQDESSDSDYKDDDYAESDEHESGESDSDLAELESSESKSLYQQHLKKWIADNYINRLCPICNEKLTIFSELKRHLILNHRESIQETESNYYFKSDSCGVCKKCNKEFISQYSRYIHSGAHSELVSKTYIHSCKICNFSSKQICVQKHILKTHSEVVKEFKPSNSIKDVKCPLCSDAFLIRSHLRSHFMDKHSLEYNEKFMYNCPLCSGGNFDAEEHFLQHLIDKHNLNSWKVLNFRKLFDHKDYFACAMCEILFLRNDTRKLLSHFIRHDTKYVFYCKFCCKKFFFGTTSFGHMCHQMIKNYERRNATAGCSRKTKSEIKNLQDFEKCITHICPFCNEEFNKMIKWQHHMRTDHEVDTLKGLQMKVVDNDSNKLRCLICDTVLANIPVQLHAHSFQHLPYKPYKCLLCFKVLNTFKMATDHVLKRCRDDDSRYDIRSILNIQCSACNFQTNNVKSVLKHYENEHNFFEDFFTKQSNNSEMTCKICCKYVRNGKMSCFLHLHRHFDEKTFKCKLCLRTYPTITTISDHFQGFHNDKPLNEELNEIEDFKPSFSINRNARYSDDIVEMTKFVSYFCPECDGCMTTKLDWDNHITAQHNFFDESNLYIKAADGSLRCPTCGISISKIKANQRRHKLTHMPYRPFRCNLCHIRNFTMATFYIHFRQKHSAQDTATSNIVAEFGIEHKSKIYKWYVPKEFEQYIIYVCPECNEFMKNQEHWHSHIITQHNFFDESNLYIKEANGSLKCPTCSVAVDTSTEKQQIHKLRHMLYKSFVCNLCFARSISLGGLIGHFRRIHFENGTFKCPICSEVLHTEYQRSEHLEKFHNSKEWPNNMCLVCFRILASKRILKDHMAIHNKDTIRYNCDICGPKVFTWGEFYAHMDNHKNGKIEEKLVDDITFPSASKSIQSNYANDIDVVPESESESTNNRKGELEELISCKSNDEIVGDISSQCSPSNGPTNDFSNRIEIFNESDTEHDFEEFISCEITDDTTSQCASANGTSVSQHINKRNKSTDSDEYDKFISYACPECNEGMASDKHWHSHIRTQHNIFDESNLYIKEADGSLKCPTCRINLAAPYRRKIHRLIHMPFKSFICNICYERFSILTGIYAHFRRTHFAKGKFKCPICNDVLQNLYQRAEHIKNIHPRKEWPELMCPICYKMHSRKFSLKRHIATCGSRISDETNNVKLGDDLTTQLALKNTQSNDTGIDIAPESQHLNKRKTIGNCSEIKKKKIDA